MVNSETPCQSLSGVPPQSTIANEPDTTSDHLLSVLSPEQRQRVHSIAQLLKDQARTQIIAFKGMNLHTQQEMSAAHGMEAMADACRLIDTPTILLAEDGEIILVYIPDFLTDEHVGKTMAAVDGLLAEVRLAPPKKDCRHE